MTSRRCLVRDPEGNFLATLDIVNPQTRKVLLSGRTICALVEFTDGDMAGHHSMLIKMDDKDPEVVKIELLEGGDIPVGANFDVRFGKNAMAYGFTEGERKCTTT